MYFFLQIYAHRPVPANDLIGASAGVCGDVPARVRDADIIGLIADCMLRALDSGSHEPAGEIRAGTGGSLRHLPTGTEAPRITNSRAKLGAVRIAKIVSHRYHEE